MSLGIEEICERKKGLFLVFKEAISGEQSAQRTYQRTMDLCDKPALREVLERLHDDEVPHERELVAYYRELRQRYDEDGKPLEG